MYVLISNMKKINHKYAIIIFNVVIGVCALAVGKWTATQLMKSVVAFRSPPQSMIGVASDALSARPFAFDYDIAIGTIGPAKAAICKESIELNLQSLLSQYDEAIPKQKFYLLLKRDVSIEDGTPEQIQAYRKLFIERELAISHEQKRTITQKMGEILGDAEGDYNVSIVWFTQNQGATICP